MSEIKYNSKKIEEAKKTAKKNFEKYNKTKKDLQKKADICINELKKISDDNKKLHSELKPKIKNLEKPFLELEEAEKNQKSKNMYFMTYYNKALSEKKIYDDLLNKWFPNESSLNTSLSSLKNLIRIL